MKSWILAHKVLSIILACAVGVGAICAIAIPVALRHKHDFEIEWTTDETYHWHKCKDEKCKAVSDKAEHVYDKEVVNEKYLAAEATYTEAAKYYKSCVCGVKGGETFNSGSSLSAKDNSIDLKEGVVLDKVYDGDAVVVDAEQIVRLGDGEITVAYKKQADGDETYSATAPVKAGDYTVKVKVAGTAEWKELEKTFNFTIGKKGVSAEATKDYDGGKVLNNVTLNGLVSGDTVSASITMNSKNVGAAVESVSLGGADADNYVIAVKDVTASITVKKISATATKVYDGGKVLNNVTLNGLVSGDTVNATVTMNSKNVGAAVESVSLGGADANNYVIGTSDVTASITAKPIIDDLLVEVPWSGESVYTLYANHELLLGAGIIAGDDVSVEIFLSGSDVGVADDEPDRDVLGNDIGNYDFSYFYILMAEIVRVELQLPEDLNFLRFANDKRIDGVYEFKNYPSEVWLISPTTDVEVFGEYTLVAKNLTLSDTEHYSIRNLDTNESVIKLNVVDNTNFYMYINEVAANSEGNVVLKGLVNESQIEIDTTAYISEIGKTVNILSITGDSDDYAWKGMYAEITVSGVTKEEVRQGMILSKATLDDAYSFRVDLATTDSSPAVITSGTSVQIRPYRTKLSSGAPYAYEYRGAIGGKLSWTGDAILKGENREGVSVELVSATPVWIDQEFIVVSGGKTIATAVVTEVDVATTVEGRVTSNPAGTFTALPVDAGHTSLTVDTARCNFSQLFTNDDEVTLSVMFSGSEIAKIVRRGLNRGELEYSYVGGSADGSKLIFDLYQNVTDVTDENGRWICEETQIYLDLTVTTKTQLIDFNINENVTVTGLSIGDTQYYTTWLEDEWVRVGGNTAQFVTVYTGGGEKVNMMGDLVYANGGGDYIFKLYNNSNSSYDSGSLSAYRHENVAIGHTEVITLEQNGRNYGMVLTADLAQNSQPYSWRLAKFSKKNAAIKKSGVKLYDENYNRINMQYVENDAGDSFYLPADNYKGVKRVYIVITYLDNLTEEVTVSYSRLGRYIDPITLSETKTVTFSTTSKERHYSVTFNKGTRYVVNILSESGVPVSNVEVVSAYDPDIEKFEIKPNVNFTAPKTGTYYFNIRYTGTLNIFTVKLTVQ